MKHTEEARQKIKAAWVERRKTFIPPMKGKKMSEESRLKMSEAAKRRGSNRTGVKHTAETKAKISAVTKERTARGATHYAYTDGRHQRDKEARRTVEYAFWRTAVFERDNYTCQHCGDKRGGNLHAHHLQAYADFPELRLEVSNGLTLCQDCHEKVHLKPIPSSPARRKKHPLPAA